MNPLLLIHSLHKLQPQKNPCNNTESKKTTTSSNVKDSSDIPMDIPSDKEDSDDNKITVEEFFK